MEIIDNKPNNLRNCKENKYVYQKSIHDHFSALEMSLIRIRMKLKLFGQCMYVYLINLSNIPV